MQILYLLAIDGLRYGVWKDEIESVQRLETIHQIPFSPPHVSGMVMLDKRGTALVDLAFILGQQEFDRDGAGFFFQVAGQDLQTGFVVAEEMTELEVNEQGIVELSDFIKTPHISTCIINGQQAIPVINIATLYQDVLSGNVEPVSPSFSLSLQTSEKDKAPAAIRLFEVGGELFAFNAEHVKADLASPTHIFPIANAPTFLLGLAAVGNSVLPIIDTAGRLALPLDRQACQIVIAEVDDQQFGFLISEDLGIKREDDFTIKMLTPLAESVWITSLAVTEEAIIPILKAPELVHSKEEGRQSILAERYEPDFTFIDKFEHEEVEVAEFLLLGAIHALPKLEVRDVMAVGSVRRLPNLQTLVIGVVQSGDEIVPVLDLAMVFGRRSIIGPDWQMLFVHNGDFKAFVVTEEVIGERTIPKNSQKDMPISLPQKLVYGCYPDKNIARLILNIEAIAVHFDKVIVEEFINTLTKEMMTAPAEIVHALLPDPHKERVVVQETSWKQDESDAGHLTEDGPEVEEFIDETAMVVDESDAGIGDVIVRHEEKSDVLGEDTVLVLDSSLEIEDEEFAQAEELTLQSKLLEKLGSEEDGEGERMEEACDFEVAPLLHEIEIGDDEEPELKARKQAEAEEAAQAEEERQRQEREEQKRQEEEAR
ncbi:MAG: chemotaxis protein CheW, partial [Thermodesulfobacteriota bacterium]